MTYEHIAAMQSHLAGIVRNETAKISAPILLPDGRDARDLRLRALYAELELVGVPGIAPSMGKDQLLALLDASLAAKAEAQRRIGAP